MDKYILKVWSGLRNEITFILSPTEKWGTKTEYTKLKKFYIKMAICELHRKCICG